MYNELMKNMKDVYSWLQDEKSRYIFRNRLMFNISGDRKYIQNISVETGKMYPYIDADGEADLVSRLRIKRNQSVIIYGAGGIGRIIFTALRKADIPIKCFWDNDQNKQDKGVWGRSVKRPGEEYSGETVIVGTGWFTDEVLNSLQLIGIPKQNIVVPIFKEAKVFAEGQYFDNEIISYDPEEVFVDCGSFDFGSSTILLNNCKTVKSIYAFEPDEFNFDAVTTGIDLCGFENVRFIPKGLWSGTTTLKFNEGLGSGSRIQEQGTTSVPVTSIDETIDEPVTFIKMDIEGAEMEALKGAAKHIVSDKPKLAICVYHKPQDIIEIPLYVKSLLPEYRLFMRHYSCGSNETVLYAII